LIAHLTGKILQKQPNCVVLDVGGVGYEVTIPLSTFYELGEIGSEVSLNIHTYVREDSIQLFGFRTAREKALFLKLMAVSGIGPRLAIAILSGMPASELIPAICNNDLAKLVAIPGVGRKTAERIVIELRDKLKALAEQEEVTMKGVGGPSAIEDVTEALIALGYPRAVAERAVAAALGEDGERTIEALLKRALRKLSR
jgi:Holliday junction DNA helicase RuvA